MNKKNILLFLGSVLIIGAVFFLFPDKKADAPDGNPRVEDPARKDLPGVQNCAFESCHGLELTCGSNAAEMCTMEYQLGDGCRQYAQCLVKDGACRLVEEGAFSSCKECVKKCQDDYSLDSSMRIFECEAECLGNQTAD